MQSIKMSTALTVTMYNMCYGLIKKRWFAKLQVTLIKNLLQKRGNFYNRYFSGDEKE